MLQKFISYLCIIFTLSGCATHYETIHLQPHVLKKPGTVVITHLSGLEKGVFLRQGPQGPLEFLANGALRNDMMNSLEMIDSKSLIDEHYYKVFHKSFSEKGFEVKSDFLLSDKDALSSASPSDEKHAPYDFKFLKDKYNAHFALVLDPKSFGVQQQFYSVMPLSDPEGCAYLDVYLVDLKDNSLLSFYKADTIRSLEPSANNSAGCASPQQAAIEALTEALRKAHLHMFGHPLDKFQLYQ